MDDVAVDIQRADELRAERSTWDANTADIADLFRPMRNELRASGYLTPQEGEKRLGKVFDGTGIMAANHLGGYIASTVANPASQWLRIGTLDPDLNDWYPVKLWCERESRRVLYSATSSFSQFYTQAAELFIDMPVQGTSVFSQEIRADQSGFTDMCRPLSECWFDTDGENRPNANYRRWCTRAVNAVKMYGGKDGAYVSGKLRDLANNKPNEKVELLHVVKPNPDYVPGRLGWRGLPFVSRYIEVAEKFEIRKSDTAERGGYEEFPFHIPRWATAAGEKMGRGHPGELARPDGGSLQAAAKSNLRAAEWAGQPPWGGPSEGVISTLRLKPNSYVFGAVSPKGDQLVRPLLMAGSIPVNQEMLESLRTQVKEFFYYSLMLTAPENRTGLAPEEIAERLQERMQIIGPYIGCLTSEFLDPWARRRFALMSRLGLVSPPPRELAGKPLQIAFTSPLAMAQKAQEASGILRSWNFIAEQAALEPEIIELWDGEQASRVVHSAFGGTATVLRAPDVYAARVQQKRQQMAAAAAAQTALPAAQAANQGAAALAQLRAARAPRAAA